MLEGSEWRVLVEVKNRPGIADPAIDRALRSMAAKLASESKRGRHSQSIEPSRATSAAVSQSPISP